MFLLWNNSAKWAHKLSTYGEIRVRGEERLSHVTLKGFASFPNHLRPKINRLSQNTQSNNKREATHGTWWHRNIIYCLVFKENVLLPVKTNFHDLPLWSQWWKKRSEFGIGVSFPVLILILLLTRWKMEHCVHVINCQLFKQVKTVMKDRWNEDDCWAPSGCVCFYELKRRWISSGRKITQFPQIDSLASDNTSHKQS